MCYQRNEYELKSMAFFKSFHMIWDHEIRACIFDFDGTLVDSEEAYSQTQIECIGRPVEWDFKVQMMGKTLLEACRLSVEHYHLDETPESYAKRYAETIDRHWATIPLMPGTMEILKKLHERGVKLCVATASSRDIFEKKVSGHPELKNMMDHIICSDDVTRGKPAPDLFLKALHSWEGISPQEALMFEDSPLGIAAANNADIPAVYVPDPHLAAPKYLEDNNAVPLIQIASFNDFDFDKFKWPI